MTLNPNQFLGHALPDLLAELQRQPLPTEERQGRVELYSTAGSRTSLLDGLRDPSGGLDATLPDTALRDTILPLNHPDVELPGLVLERYLGGGAQGLVYAGRVAATQKLVAVKVLRVEETAARRWALREAAICSQLRHPNVLRVFEAQRAGAFWVVVMELVQGMDLGRQPLTPTQARRCFAQIADALQALAQRHIVHRDIKPGNVLLRQVDGSPVLVDFGLAVDLERPEREEVRLSGTPLFMAPEAFDDPTPTPAWDAYALGVSAAFVLVGLEDRYQSVPELIEAKRSGAFDRTLAHALGATGDLELRDWVAALLDRAPQRRLEALEDTRRWLAA